ncbi:MAG TPA: phosphoribosyltransferase family protein [Thermodesulfovibrionales bacterium]|nr:phosphoribosyltransferase family protein [Thermodesulfovibrionales bacterium]
MGRLVEDISLRDRKYMFRDRRDAGRRLSLHLSQYQGPDSMVLAIPAGGVPVASEVGDALGLPMDLIIVRKVQIPGNTEAGFGAMGTEGEVILNEGLLQRIGLTEEEITVQIKKTRDIIRKREQLFRKDRPLPSIKDRNVIIIDDGLASGYTMLAAVSIVKSMAPRKIIVAVPTASRNTADFILPQVDELVCLNIRSRYPFAVAEAYVNWHDLTDEEVLKILNSIGKGDKHVG